MARIDPNDPRPPYHQIADDIRGQIATGALTEGQKLASLRDLSTAYGVAPMTVHQAIRVLRDEGLLRSYQGRGVFVESTVVSPIRLKNGIDGAGLGEALASRIDALEEQLDEVDTRTVALAELRSEVADLRAHLIELYARTGHQYPHTDAKTKAEQKAPRRRASGA